MKIDMLKNDHQDLLSMCQQVESLCCNTLSSHGIESILTLLRELETTLGAHLVCEDKYLYPYLLQHQESSAVRQVATKFKREMGGLSHTLLQFFTKWSPKNAANSNVLFVCELCELVGSIRTRILKEDAVLFPLMEENGSSQSSAIT